MLEKNWNFLSSIRLFVCLCGSHSDNFRMTFTVAVSKLFVQNHRSGPRKAKKKTQTVQPLK